MNSTSWSRPINSSSNSFLSCYQLGDSKHSCCRQGEEEACSQIFPFTLANDQDGGYCNPSVFLCLSIKADILVAHGKTETLGKAGKWAHPFADIVGEWHWDVNDVFDKAWSRVMKAWNGEGDGRSLYDFDLEE